MRIDYFCDIEVRKGCDEIIHDTKTRMTLVGYKDTDDADLTVHMDGALDRTALKAVPIEFIWDPEKEVLKSRISFRCYENLSESNLIALTDYVRGQLCDGYGENPIPVKNGPEMFEVYYLDETMTGPVVYDDGVKVRAPGKRKQLSWAIEDANLLKVKKLLESGVNPNIADKWGTNSLYFAASRGHVEIVRCLLEHGGEANIRAMDGAAHSGSIKIIQLLLDAGCPVDREPAMSDEERKMSPLSMALCWERDDAVELLLKAGADPNVQGDHGTTPLMYAKSIKALDFLLQAGADAFIQTDRGRDAQSYHDEQAESWEGAQYPNRAKKIKGLATYLRKVANPQE